MRSVVKTFDGDRYWAAALLHDRILKTAQVKTKSITVFKLEILGRLHRKLSRSQEQVLWR
jgi:hypothetical protein